jgi:hypothetical protein
VGETVWAENPASGAKERKNCEKKYVNWPQQDGKTAEYAA